MRYSSMNNKKRGITLKKIFLKKIKCFFAILAVVFAFQMVFLQVDNGSLVYAEESKDIYYGDELYNDQTTEGITEIEQINYSTQQEFCNFTNVSYPMYYNMNNELLNACANSAGVNILGFYDRYYNSLIPDCAVGYMSVNFFNYYPMGYVSKQVQSVIEDLYIRMSTNSPEAGTTQAQFRNGLNSYVSSKGLSTTYYSVMNGNSLDINKVITQIDNGYPVTLYLSGYNISNITNDNGVSTLEKKLFNSNHIMIAHGYKIIDYLDENGQIVESKICLHVAPGIDLGSWKIYIVGDNGKVNYAEATKIT